MVRRQNDPGSSGIYCSRSRIFETAVWFGRHIVEAEVSDGSFDLVFLQAELEIGMSSEKPRNHLDLRNRLNSRGQREGKVIDYRVSELRIVELLDDLCDKMQDYTLQKLDSGEKEWVKVTNWNSYQTDKKAAARAHSKNLSSYCGRLLEETEDELAEWIKTSSAEAGNVSKALCGDISKHCQSTRATTPIDDEL
ncbi:protein canopy-1-like isoform X1 [Lolium rigidum]|uniref:protein canopy-1-like isoform X1 n=1 Tax=Lolium rigidum TaxID=89674 RepID=UPI001F5DFDF9|nr:protein canopy-1-like isoform X1 [Lolium rigidum]